jgi:heterotetrameric sarcosine oxidase gamma subunit
MTDFVQRERSELAIATVLARKGKTEALRQRVAERMQIDLPEGPRRTVRESIAFVGIGPGAWLAVQDRGGNAFAAALKATLGDFASITDQSDAYVVWRFSGRTARNELCKVIPVDLHTAAFKVDDAACTLAGHMEVTLWRLADDAEGASAFEIAIARSCAANLSTTATASIAGQ